MSDASYIYFFTRTFKFIHGRSLEQYGAIVNEQGHDSFSLRNCLL